MVSKNNVKFYQEQTAQRVSHYGIRKLSVGVASVLLSTTLYLGGSALVAHADAGATATTNETTQPVVNTSQKLNTPDSQSNGKQLTGQAPSTNQVKPNDQAKPTTKADVATPVQMGLLAQLKDALSTKPELSGVLMNKVLPTLNQTNPTSAAVQEAINAAEAALKAPAPQPAAPKAPTDTTEYANSVEMGQLAQLKDALSTRSDLNGLLMNEVLPKLNQANPTKAEVEKAIADAEAALKTPNPEYATSVEMGQLAQLRDALSTKPQLTGLLMNEVMPTLNQVKPTKVAVEKATADAMAALKNLKAAAPMTPADTTEYASAVQMGLLAQLRDALSTKPELTGLLMNEVLPTLNQAKPTKAAVEKATADAEAALKGLQAAAPETPADTTEYATSEQMGLLAQLRDALSTKPELTGLLMNEVLPTLNQAKPTKAAVEKAINDAINALEMAKMPATSTGRSGDTGANPNANTGEKPSEGTPTDTSTGQQGGTTLTPGEKPGQNVDNNLGNKTGNDVKDANKDANKPADTQSGQNGEKTATQQASQAAAGQAKQAMAGQKGAVKLSPVATTANGQMSRMALRAAKEQQKKATLPKTGDQTAAGVAALGLVGLTAALGMFGLQKKREF